MAARCAALLERDWMIRELARIVDIASPTGEERALAEHLVLLMRELGLKAQAQPIDALSANAIGELGDGDGPSVMLFAPLDSAFSGREDARLRSSRGQPGRRPKKPGRAPSQRIEPIGHRM